MKTNPLAHMLPPQDEFAGLPIAQDSAFPLNAGASADIPVTPAEDEAMRVLEQRELVALAEGLSDIAAGRIVSLEQVDLTLNTKRHEEWHVTVKGDPIAWAAFCAENGIKPLHIELSNRETQLMCAASFDPRALIHEVLDENERQLFTIIRVKHEVSDLLDGEVALYWEAHVKFNGPFRVDRKGTSRDLFRTHQQRWYMTHRQATPFEAEAFAARAQMMSKPSQFAECEYEACILDTNPALDGGWL
jgi:hypothetical protein